MESQVNTAWAVALLALALGCGDDGEGEPSPKRKCEKIVDTICDRFMACAEAAGGYPSKAQERQARADCDANFGVQASCESVIAVDASYEQCLDVLAVEQCSALIATAENPVYDIPRVCMILTHSPPTPGTSFRSVD